MVHNTEKLNSVIVITTAATIAAATITTSIGAARPAFAKENCNEDNTVCSGGEGNKLNGGLPDARSVLVKTSGIEIVILHVIERTANVLGRTNKKLTLVDEMGIKQIL